MDNQEDQQRYKDLDIRLRHLREHVEAIDTTIRERTDELKQDIRARDKPFEKLPDFLDSLLAYLRSLEKDLYRIDLDRSYDLCYSLIMNAQGPGNKLLFWGRLQGIHQKYVERLGNIKLGEGRKCANDFFQEAAQLLKEMGVLKT